MVAVTPRTRRFSAARFFVAQSRMPQAHPFGRVSAARSVLLRGTLAPACQQPELPGQVREPWSPLTGAAAGLLAVGDRVSRLTCLTPRHSPESDQRAGAGRLKHGTRV